MKHYSHHSLYSAAVHIRPMVIATQWYAWYVTVHTVSKQIT